MRYRQTILDEKCLYQVVDARLNWLDLTGAIVKCAKDDNAVAMKIADMPIRQKSREVRFHCFAQPEFGFVRIVGPPAQ